jgi:hypothetical protein
MPDEVSDLIAGKTGAAAELVWVGLDQVPRLHRPMPEHPVIQFGVAIGCAHGWFLQMDRIAANPRPG